MPQTDSGRSAKRRLPPSTGMAPAFSQGTAATDNLAAMMKNRVLVGFNIRRAGAPPRRSLDRDASDVREES